MFELIDFETGLRVAVFAAVLAAMLFWEATLPRRQLSSRLSRWPANLGIFLINVLLLTLMPLSAIGASLISIEYTFGLFFWYQLSFWPKVFISLILLDLLIYWQHRLFHKMNWGWKLHRMHHTDTEFDVTTALRFHPLEILVSVLIKAVAIILLGAPPFAVILFEIVLNGAAMFNHSNIKIPLWLDRIMRIFVVTPDMHRVHHSIHSHEHNSNYGFCLSIWDKIFNSYIEYPQDGHQSMRIGLNIFNDESEKSLIRLVTQPFR